MRRALAISVLLCAFGCVGTPLPQPPALEPPRPEHVGFDTSGSVVRFFGGPGTVDPGIPTLWMVNLDSTDDPTVLMVDAEGGFFSGPAVSDGDVVRMQARDGDARSRPVDVPVPISGELVRPTEDCLELDPRHELLFEETPVAGSSARTITITNRCGAEARIASADLRRPADYVVSVAGLVIPDETSASVRVEWTPSASGLSEEILFLRVDAPEMDRRPITLSGTAP